MWRVASSLFAGKSRLFSPSFLHLNAAAAPLHTSPTSRNSHVLTLAQLLEILDVKCKTGFDHVDDAHALFHRMLQLEPLPLVSDFSRLLKGVVKMKEFRSAVFLYKEMRFHGVPIDDHTMSTAINCYCHLNQVGLGFSILASIFKLGFKPDVITLTTLIHGLIKADRIAEAVELFKTMVIQKDCTLTTYGTVIDGLCKSGNTFKAIELLRFVEKEGPLKPNPGMYNTIIGSLCKEEGGRSSI